MSIKCLKFWSIFGKAKEIELEWRKIQQDEHNEYFRYQVMKGSNEKELAYKSGVVDGIKWCIKHFS